MNTWEELVDKQSKEYAAHLENVKQSREQLQASKQAILSDAKCSEAELPLAQKDLLQLNEEYWKREYGMYGSKFKEMRMKHEKELNNFFYRQAKIQDLSKPNDKSKDKSAGR
jgi:hypothetical protein